MKRFATALTALAVVPVVLVAQEVEVDAKAELVEQYTNNLEEIKKATSYLTDEQWNFKSAPDRWSVAEVLEHITISEAGLMVIVRDSLTEKEVSAEDLAAAEQKQAGITASMRDRTQTFDAPPPFVPTGSLGESGAVLEAFVSTRGETLALIEGIDYDLRTRVAPHPFLEEADAQTWLVQIVEHGARHVEQINEVKAHPDFPTGTNQ